MEEMKFRFVFKNGNDIQFRYMDLDELLDFSFALEQMQEDLGGGDGLSEDHIEYELISKDQYAGLKDKNEVEIYKGDIVKTTCKYDGVLIDEVGFYNGCWKVKNEKDGVSNYPLHNYGVEKVEVIGNIHQNPELLKQSP